MPYSDLGHLNSNPYQATARSTPPTSDVTPRRFSRIRFWLYAHVVTLLGTTVFTLVETRMFAIPAPFMVLAGLLFLVGFAALFICPVAILICTLRSDLNPTPKLAVLVLEIIVVRVHLLALLPTVQ